PPRKRKRDEVAGDGGASTSAAPAGPPQQKKRTPQKKLASKKKRPQAAGGEVAVRSLRSWLDLVKVPQKGNEKGKEWGIVAGKESSLGNRLSALGFVAGIRREVTGIGESL
ncbi:hypothetical protein GUJ93_ZPchr0002g25094, partial [Zizania palustris]